MNRILENVPQNREPQAENLHEKMPATALFSVRLATYPDLVAIAELEKECFPDPWNHKMLSDGFLSGTYTFFVLEKGEKIVGYASMTAVFEDGDLDKICVIKEERGRGGAGLLMQKIMERSRELSLCNLFLEVRVSNAPAMGLYKSFGFTPVSVRKRYYPDGEDAAVYRKTFD